jgi:hypothetical protein
MAWPFSRAASAETSSVGDNSFPEPCSFDEFKLYYESTEKVTERRLAANRWNYSISVAILLGLVSAYGWSTRHRDFFLLALIAIAMVSALASLFCLFWLRQVQDWKALNNAKFKVLAEMTKGLQFDLGDRLPSARSYRPFDREWEILQSQDGLTKVRLRLGQIEALNASGAELFLPRAFMGIFSLLAVVGLVVAVLSWSSVPHAITPRGKSDVGPTVNSSARVVVTSDVGPNLGGGL